MMSENDNHNLKIKSDENNDLENEIKEHILKIWTGQPKQAG